MVPREVDVGGWQVAAKRGREVMRERGGHQGQPGEGRTAGHKCREAAEGSVGKGTWGQAARV